MAHYNEKGEWVWTEDEFRQNLSQRQRDVLSHLDEYPDGVNPYNKGTSEHAYYNEVVNGRKSLDLIEKAEWGLGILGILGIVSGIGSLFYWVVTS